MPWTILTKMWQSCPYSLFREVAFPFTKTRYLFHYLMVDQKTNKARMDKSCFNYLRILSNTKISFKEINENNNNKQEDKWRMHRCTK